MDVHGMLQSPRLIRGLGLFFVADAQGLLEAWRQDYNESRPHSTLNALTPAEYARKIKKMGPA